MYAPRSRSRSQCFTLVEPFDALRAPRAGHGAFTLVELLCVLAIIGLLLVLLFPSLKSARAKAQAAGCASNLSQISTAINAWTSDHNGNFLGMDVSGWWTNSYGFIGTYGHGSHAWYNMLGQFGYLNRQYALLKLQHMNTLTYGTKLIDHLRYTVLRDPGEPEWTTARPEHTYPNGLQYRGRPYTMWTHSYIGSSYQINHDIGYTTWCTCDRGLSGAGYVCSSDYCGNWGEIPDENTCCSVGYSTVNPGVEPARALVIMDRYNSGYPAWHWEGVHYWELGYENGYITNTYHMTDPGRLHAYRHPGGRANMLFHDGHVQAVPPAEYVALQERVQINVWPSHWQ